MAISTRVDVALVGCLLFGVLVTPACGFPRPADVGPDEAPGGTTCQLTAIGPSIANADDTIMMEGTFVEPVTVNFPGGTSVPATVLGPHRATTTVPAFATEGDLTVTACALTVGPLPFRRASFPTGLGVFEASVEQTGGAYWNARLVAARHNHSSVVIGRYVYVLGGVGDSGSLNTVERASSNADGSLGPFAAVPGVNLVTARQAHTIAVIGNHLYVIGGIGNGTPLNSVEGAIIAPDGTLGPFATVSEVTLATAREGHTSAVVGNYLYVLGGAGSNALNSVERAIINSDDSLGPFATVLGATLMTARRSHATVVVGNYLYVLGGARSSGLPLQDVERATIDPDGSLGPFASISGAALMTARSGHTTTALGNYLYVVGGDGVNSPLSSVERAPLAVDGSIGSFTVVPGVTLTTARHGHSIAAIGNYLYILGGIGSDSSLSSVERATLNASGAAGTFTTIGVALTSARSGFTTTVIGRYLYALGGTLDDSIEQATISADGSLGPFGPAPVIMTASRTAHTTAVIGNYFYLIGGVRGLSTATDSIERSTINPDGSLGPFSIAPGITLVTARYSHTSAVAGNYFYVLGGASTDALGQTQFRRDVERAPINTDGSLGSFEIMSGMLTIERVSHSTVVIGHYLYVIGGIDFGPGHDIERAIINADGSLGPFAIVSGATLMTRNSYMSTVVGNYLYVLGGMGSDPGQDVERATINADGSLGPFAIASGLTTGRRGATSVTVENYLYLPGGTVDGKSTMIQRATLNTGGPAEQFTSVSEVSQIWAAIDR
jgi:N-acetylneuraminic acid mutarotase